MVANAYRSVALVLAWSAPLCIAGFIPVPVQAQAQSLHAGTLEVPLNKSQVVTTDRPIARAISASRKVVGNVCSSPTSTWFTPTDPDSSSSRRTAVSVAARGGRRTANASSRTA